MEVLGIKKVVSVLEHKYSASPMELVSHAFKCFDTDGNGTLSKAEVQQIVGGVQFERGTLTPATQLAPCHSQMLQVLVDISVNDASTVLFAF